MPVRYWWHDEAKTIMRYEFVGKWNWDEVYQTFQAAFEEGKAQPHRVDIVIDMLHSEGVPPSIVTHLKFFAEHQNPNVILNLFVTQNRFLSMLYSTAVRVYPKIGAVFQVVKTVDEAFAAIANARELVPS